MTQEQRNTQGADQHIYPARPFDHEQKNITIFGALLNAVKMFGFRTIALDDQDRGPMSYGQLAISSLIIGHKLADMTDHRERVGVMLPNMAAFISVLCGLNAFGRVSVLLNFTAGIRNIEMACQASDLKHIVTSRRFVEYARLDQVINALQEKGLTIIYLEDIRDKVTRLDKVVGIAGYLLGHRVLRTYDVQPQHDAVILFTSGSEGGPKGVVLTNANIMANVAQVREHVRQVIKNDDIVFNPLPMFHSFGLVAGGLLWVLSGKRLVLYPNPLQYKKISQRIAETKATILISTDTFSRNYARAADDGELATIRHIISGAEAVRPESRALWAKYGTSILEGYGITEASPILAVNLPMAQKIGSVGQIIPGIEARLVAVEGLSEGGRLQVRGPNIMRGYLDLGRDNHVIESPDGWHDTGDIVEIDDNGYITIRGRAKRFAKIAGEMVSLSAIEFLVQKLWPDDVHAVVSLPDTRKGEQIILATNRELVDRDELLAFAKQEGFSELWVPRTILVFNIPVLSSGKIDYVTTTNIVKERSSMS